MKISYIISDDSKRLIGTQKQTVIFKPNSKFSEGLPQLRAVLNNQYTGADTIKSSDVVSSNFVPTFEDLKKSYQSTVNTYRAAKKATVRNTRNPWASSPYKYRGDLMENTNPAPQKSYNLQYDYRPERMR